MSVEAPLTGIAQVLGLLWLCIGGTLVVGWAVAWLFRRVHSRTLAFSSDWLATVARGDKPGWDLDVYGTHVVLFRREGATGGLMRTSAPGIWLVGEPDSNNWRCGRRITGARLAKIAQQSPAYAPKEPA